MKTSSAWSVGLLSCAALVAVSTGCVNRSKTAAAGTPPAAAPAAAGAPPTQVGPRYRVREASTSFYHYGPQQAGGPDLSLKKGTDVIIIKRSFGYSQVKTTDNQGQTGYVGTQDISPLTQQELTALAAAAAPTAPVQSVGGPGKRSRAIVGEYNLPPGGLGTGANVGPGATAPDGLPMPAENTPTPPPTNMFRY